MAGKPPRKSTKSTSAKKATSQTASTVTPISEGVKHGEIQNRAAQVNAPSAGTQAGNKAAGQKAPEQKITDQKTDIHKVESQKTASHAVECREAEASKTGHQITNQIANQITRHEIAEHIRVRAYELFEQRGRHEGHDHEDWARAEAEILSKYQREKSA
jgi:hypothetical protein